jgi:hypothetical protein
MSAGNNCSPNEMMEESCLDASLNPTSTIVVAKISGGVITEVYATNPVSIVVVDTDMIECRDSSAHRKKKSVFNLTRDECISYDDIDRVVTNLLDECKKGREEI